MLNAAARYFHTLRHLKARQIVARARFRLQRPAVPSAEPLARAAGGEGWVVPPGREPVLTGPWRVRLLGREREIGAPSSWQDADPERLWLYNLHYFDDLNAREAPARSAWQRAWIARWPAENPPVSGVGWEPYPVSLRAVNWIKWVLAGNAATSAMLASLAQQLRHLSRRVEWHLLGNHLLANAKTLVFGGAFFGGAEADVWLAQGAEILEAELAEQVLSDGGHFERSPIYHALALEDALDLVNLLRAYPRRAFVRRAALEAALRDAAPRMQAWLEAMCHPDGGIAYFNDCAFGVALEADALRGYGAALGLMAALAAPGSLDLAASGYARLKAGDWCAIFDAAPVGPDYLPGHAHADTLTFELSLGAERVVSNSGTSTYEVGRQRSFERSTRAHDTVEIDGEDSSEVWSSFRVARRARPLERSFERTGAGVRAACAHDGYTRLRGAPVHRREVEVAVGGIAWADRVEGTGRHRVRGRLPLHPGVRASLAGSRAILSTGSGARLELRADGVAALELEGGTYAPCFGRVEPRQVIAWTIDAPLPVEARFTLRRA